MVGALLAAGPAVRAQEEPEPLLSLDEQYARLAEEVPGFGGLYLDAEGTTHVYLQDLSLADEVQDLGERVEVHQGEYDFRELFVWKDAVRDLLAQRGTVFLDIDEQRNRLLFGVERESLAAFTAELPAFLRRARVPAEAVIVEAVEPIVSLEQLTDKIRPVPGGVQIRNQNGGVCTLGFNATRLGVRGFVTNSHCTATRSVVEGTTFFQSTLGSSNLIGTEIADPPFFTGGSCPSGRVCRRSDAAFVDYAANSLSEKGKVANPFICGVAGVAGTLDVNPFVPRLSVTPVLLGSLVSGSVVTKVGRTTGCTIGAQTNTCMDSNVTGSNITMLCQDRVSALSLPGDSGSPVFLQQQGLTARPAGILWGGNGSSYVYSPWIFLHMELNGVLPDLP